MKKNFLTALIFVGCSVLSFAQTHDDQSYESPQSLQEQMFQMMERMSEQFGGFGGSSFQIDTTFFKNFEHFNPEDLGLGDVQIYMDTLLMQGFSDGDDWIEINPGSNDINFQEMLEKMNKQMEQMGQSFNLEDLLQGLELSPAIPAPDQLDEATPLDEKGHPLPKKKRKSFSL